MKRSLLALIPAVSLALAVAGCGEKAKQGPVDVKSYAEYNDEILKFSVRYPSDWAKGIQSGSQAVFYSSQAISDGFTNFAPNGQVGAKVHVFAMVGGEQEMQASINDLKAQFTDPTVVKAPEQTTLGANTATKVHYELDLDDDAHFTADRYYMVKDGAVSYLETAVIGDYAAYASVFDTARASFRPAMVGQRPVIDTAAGTTTPADTQLVEAPSADMKSYSNQHMSIQYPGNFSPGTARAGGALASTIFSGARNDSYYQVDVIDPKGMDLAAIVEQNKRNYGGRAASPASVGNQKGFVFSYNGGRDVTSRAYFAVANGKLYRITMNWYTPQQDNYQAAFAKALATFQPK